ncbi:uncharacterized protein LOC100908025 [Galendromus occidentalis]|uniref:Uncharacterized protein LOC100908025 n=1 Tax=Galendromus occidentalis TaxID=34638 RepID=A0AAJ6QQ60_9ACAR|nr:uncharacterized protein LOC100908025 [Galendromus occidentalis]
MVDEPNNLDEVYKSVHCQQWLNAMAEEIASMEHHKVWELVDLPRGKRAVGDRWIFKVKKDAHGNVERFRARLVVKGYDQRPGRDFGETFSPVARFDEIKTLQAIAAKESLALYQFDVKTAFLNSELNEEVYTTKPEGFSDNSGRVCKLLKAVYGLKQSSRARNQEITKRLVGMGMTQSKADPCVYYTEGKTRLIVALYVDDGLTMGRDLATVQESLEKLGRQLEITSKPLIHFLGMHVEISDDRSEIKIHKSNYISELLERFQVKNSKETATPIDNNSKSAYDDEIDPSLPYREIIGALLYLTIATREKEEHNTLLVTTGSLLGLLSSARLIHADATYKICPKHLCKQLFTIHGNRSGHVVMVACAFMNKSDSEAYGWIFRQLKLAAPGLTVAAYMGDWDGAMSKAVRSKFDDVDLYGCHFHFAQSLVRRARGKWCAGLGNGIRKPGEVLSIFLGFSVLPLLPPEMILPTFGTLAARARTVHVGFPGFLDYIESHWLQRIGPEDLSVFGLRQRTNDDVESNNGKLLRKVGPHGPVWSLIATIAECAQDVMVDKIIHSRGVEHILSRPRKATKFNKLRVKLSWELLTRGEISAVEFIERVKYKVGKRNHLLCLKGHIDTGYSEKTPSICIDIDDDHNYAKKPNRAQLSPNFCASPAFDSVNDGEEGRKENVPDEGVKVFGDVSISRLGVTANNLNTLAGTNWLNDKIIDIYLNLIVNRNRDSPHLPKVFSFSTFFLDFYKRHGYDEVSKWTRRDDIFAKDIFLVPVYTKSHWCMASIDWRTRVIKYMDSLGGQNDDCLSLLRTYLAQEMAHKKNCELDLSEWHVEYANNIPQQRNSFDCGVFALKYADHIAQDAKINFSQEDMPAFRESLMLEILQSSLIL